MGSDEGSRSGSAVLSSLLPPGGHLAPTLLYILHQHASKRYQVIFTPVSRRCTEHVLARWNIWRPDRFLSAGGVPDGTLARECSM